jgi:hypothetical protein
MGDLLIAWCQGRFYDRHACQGAFVSFRDAIDRINPIYGAAMLG